MMQGYKKARAASAKQHSKDGGMSKKEAFHEVYHNVPKNVKATGKTGAAKHKMMTAIALSKAGMSKKK